MVEDEIGFVSDRPWTYGPCDAFMGAVTGVYDAAGSRIGFFGKAEDAEHVAALSARVVSLKAQLAERPKVKPLEWSELGDHEPGWWVAENESLGLGYEVRVNSRDIVRVRFPRMTWETFDGTVAEAKAAAQADYERRILSACALAADPPAKADSAAALRAATAEFVSAQTQTDPDILAAVACRTDMYLGADLEAENDRLREAADNIAPYLRWTISEESPGHHPTMPSAVGAFLTAFDIDSAEKRTARVRRLREAGDNRGEASGKESLLAEAKERNDRLHRRCQIAEGLHQSVVGTLSMWHKIVDKRDDESFLLFSFALNDMMKAKERAERRLSALEPLSPVPEATEKDGWNLLSDRTFAVQHNPNCPAPYLVRIPGKSGIIDMKAYGDPLGLVSHQTDDILGFGKTFLDAARAAINTTREAGL